MKYRLMGIAGVVLILLTAAVAAALGEPADESGRVHQHLTARRDTGCGCDGTELCSHLPLVIIDTGGAEVPGKVQEGADRFGQELHSLAEDGETTILARISIVDHPDRNNHPSDTPEVTSDCRFRIRGNSSRNFPKKPYAVSFVDEDGANRSISVMGMDAHHEWALHGPSLDKALVRNYMWYNIAGELMHYAPNCRYCEVVLNGEYMGLYLMVETVTAGDGCRLNLKMNVKGSQATGYLIRSDRPVEEDLETLRDIYSFTERTSMVYEDFAIRYPGRNTLTPELAKNIELSYSAFEKALFSYDYNAQDYGYWNWIDVDNFVDYYLINEFTRNVDAGRYSTFLYKEMSEPIRLCVWDFNNACDNYREVETIPRGMTVHGRAWFQMLFRSEPFVQRVLDRYYQLREGWLSEETLLSYVDGTLDWLGPAVERNNARWPVGQPGENTLEPEERNPRTHREAVEQLKTWLAARGDWLDRNIDTLRQYAHPSRNKLYNH